MNSNLYLGVSLAMSLCLPSPAAAAQEVPASVEPEAATCELRVAEIVAGEARISELQAQLSGTVQSVEGNSRNAQAVLQAGQALSWATAALGMVPGVGFAASAAGAAATNQAIQAQQRATTATNQTLQTVVQELGLLGRRQAALRAAASAQGCEAPPPPVSSDRPPE